MRIAWLVGLLTIASTACGGTLLDDDGGVDDASAPKDGPTKDVILSKDSSACATPLQQCGATCVDTTNDPNHCGSCTNVCPSFDGGAATCSAGVCGVTCPAGLTSCGDGVCYDLQSSHDHCGSCATACPPNEACTQGKCGCGGGLQLCNGVCTDVLSDPSNCGGCGNPCPPQSVCSGGACTTTTGNTYTQSFTQSVVATQQCIAWDAWRAGLTGTYTSVTLSGSNDTTGRTCTGTGANTLCQALHNGTTTNVTCGGFTWYVDFCSNMTWELTADNVACTCTDPGYNVRPCINTNGDWGGITTKTCAAPTQSITVSCQ